MSSKKVCLIKRIKDMDVQNKETNEKRKLKYYALNYNSLSS